MYRGGAIVGQRRSDEPQAHSDAGHRDSGDRAATCGRRSGERATTGHRGSLSPFRPVTLTCARAVPSLGIAQQTHTQDFDDVRILIGCGSGGVSYRIRWTFSPRAGSERRGGAEEVSRTNPGNGVLWLAVHAHKNPATRTGLTPGSWISWAPALRRSRAASPKPISAAALSRRRQRVAVAPPYSDVKCVNCAGAQAIAATSSGSCASGETPPPLKWSSPTSTRARTAWGSSRSQPGVMNRFQPSREGQSCLLRRGKKTHPATSRRPPGVPPCPCGLPPRPGVRRRRRRAWSTWRRRPR